MAGIDPNELFSMLESNNPDEVAEVKALIHENLGTTKEPWLLNGLIDYYLSTDSRRCLDILIGIREPHYKHLFDKINDCLKGSSRMQALTLLGHIVRKQPSWLHKIANHSIFSTLLKILKNENDVLIIMTALLDLVILLPMIPSLVAPYLTEVFEIFSRLAGWKVKKPGHVPDIYILHLQVGVYALFHRLYGMYPCNFLSYLRSFYGKGEQLHVFTETVRPMLERVRMHPLLVTASKEMEVSNIRWKKMETHDIVVECAKLSLDLIEGSREEISHSSYPYPCLPQQQGPRETNVSFQQQDDSVSKASEAAGQSLEQHSILEQLLQESTDVSPSTMCGLSTPLPLQTSPDATLLNTPQSASLLTPLESPLLEPDSANSVGSRSQASRSGPPTPSPGSFHLPCSPLRKEGSPFKFPPTTEHTEKTKGTELKTPSKSRIQTKALSFTSENISIESTSVSVPSTSDSTKLVDSDTKQSTEEEKCEDQEVSEIVGKNLILSNEAKESGQESPFHCTTTNLTAGQQSGEGFQRSDSLLHDEPDGGGGFSSMEYEESAQVSMVQVMDYMRRFRYYSQCGPAPDLSEISIKPPLTRSRSCPEIKKDKKTKEEENPKKPEEENPVVSTVNPPENVPKAKTSEKKETDVVKQVSEQSDEWKNQQPKASSLSRPKLPYEDLFPLTLPVAIIPKCPQCLHCQESLSQGQKSSFPFYHLSPPEILDRHIQFGSNILAKELKSLPITTSKVTNWAHFGGPPPADEINILRGQVLLLHNQLLYERHKREIHAERNRRLLGKAKNARALEEQNIAMKDQMQLQERDIARLSTAHNTLLRNNYQLRDDKEKEVQERLSQIRNLRQENEQLKFANKELQALLVEHKTENDILQKEDKQMKKRLYEMSLDLEGAKEQLSHNKTLKEEVDRLNKELILMGELQNKYREKFSNIPVSRQSESEANEATEAYVREVAAIRESLNSKNCQIDMLRSRIAELENTISRKDSIISDQKKILKTVKEKFDEEIQAKEDLQQEITILAISIRSSCLALQAKIPIPPVAIGAKACVMSQGESPSTSSLDTSGIDRSRITEGNEEDDELPEETYVVLADSETSKESVS